MVSYLLVLLLCLYRYGDQRDLHVLTHSFPTRRSSDLPVLKFVPVVGENDGPLGLGRLRRLVSLKRRGERERLGLVLRGAFRFGGRSVIRGRHDEPTGRFFADKRIDARQRPPVTIAFRQQCRVLPTHEIV